MKAFSSIEYASLTEDQRRRHGDPTGASDEEIASVFTPAPRLKVGWSTHALWMCTANVQDSTVIYEIPKSAHRLLYTTMVQTLPAIQVRPKYADRVRVCWPPYVAHHIIRHGELHDGGSRRQVLPAAWLDFHAQFFIDKTPAYNRMTGNVDELTQWSTSLPRYTVQKSHPWFYAQSLESSIPLDAEREGGKLQHVYLLRHQIAELLRMQMWNANVGAWVDIRPNMKYLVNITKGAKFDTPQLWACLANRTDAEHLATLETHPVNVEYLDVTYEEERLCVKAGQDGRLVPASRTPCESLFFGAIRNNPVVGIEYLGNYSDNPLGPCEDDERGRGPFSRFTIFYRELKRGIDIPAELLEYSTPMHHFPYMPEYPGYYAYPYALRPGDFVERQTGIPLSALSASIQFSLRGEATSNTIEGEEESDDGEEGASHLTVSAAESASRAAAALTSLSASAHTSVNPDAGAAAVGGGVVGDPVTTTDRYLPPEAEYRTFCISLIQASIAYVYNPAKGQYVVASTVEDARALINGSSSGVGSRDGLAIPTPRVVHG